MSLIIPANSLSAGGYTVDNSCRFDDGSTDNLARTPSSASNKRTFTFSFWYKRSNLTGSTKQTIFSATDSNVEFFFWIDSERFLIYATDTGGSRKFVLQPTQLLRDTSAWYHIVVAIDTTQGTEANRAKIYINGSQVTDFTTYLSTSQYPTQNYDTAINTTNAHTIGVRPGSSMNMNGYLSEFCFIDGTANAVTDFGEFDEDSGIWKPIAYAGTYGTNGFYLEIKDSGALGADTSGNANNFTVNNLTAVDQTTDTPTNNFATGNPLNVPTSNKPTFTNGNNTVAIASASRVGLISTLGITQSKWYSEFKLTATSSVNASIGITGESSDLCIDNNFGGQSASNGVSYTAEGTLYDDGVTTTSWGDTFAVNDIIGVAVDLDNNYIYFAKNGTWQNSGDPTSGASGTGGISLTSVASVVERAYFFNTGCLSVANTNTISVNFGNAPYTISSGNADANGYGNFEYLPPSGYLSLCTKNLSEILS